jgi:D-glycerate 3-kinase
VNQSIFNRLAGCKHSLGQYLTTENSLCSNVPACAPEQVNLKLFQPDVIQKLCNGVFAVSHSTFVSLISVKFPAMSQFIAAAKQWLSTNTSILPDRQQALADIVPSLLSDYPASSQKITSIAGPPGTGKSTLAGACSSALENTGVSCLVLSLDDYYLPRTERMKLAKEEHSLFAVRGVPGTHDLSLLMAHLDALKDSGHGPLEIPLFDKFLDDRQEDVKIVDAGFVPDHIFIEGWVAGVPPQSGGKLLNCMGQFEEENDADGEWRMLVNANLYDYFSELDSHIDERWFLNAPNWDSVIEWRLLQEQSSPNGLLKNSGDVGRFLDYYHRLCAHMQAECESWANVIIDLDARHMPKIREF